MDDDKKIPVISRCQIVTGKADKKFDDLNLINLGDSKIYDFGSKSAFFCIISDKADEIKSLSNEILDYLFDDYVFIDIYKNTSPYICIGVSYACLGDYIPEIFNLKDERIEEVLKKLRLNLLQRLVYFLINIWNFTKIITNQLSKRCSCRLTVYNLFAIF